MQARLGTECFLFSYTQTASPPITPIPPPASADVAWQAVSLSSERLWRGTLGSMAPAHIRPRGQAHEFSYTPPQLDHHDDIFSSSDDEDEWLSRRRLMREERRLSRNTTSQEDYQDVRDTVEITTATISTTSLSIDSADEEKPSTHGATPVSLYNQFQVFITEQDSEFTLEELDDDAVEEEYDLEVLRPDHIEDARSDKGTDDRKDPTQTLTDQLRQLQCDIMNQPSTFDQLQRLRYLRRRKRWSMGGSHKRSHTQSIGSDTDDGEDIEPLDAQQVGSCARRLRRRTKGPEDMGVRPRHSLLFEDPPAEIEELAYLADIPPDLAEDVAELDALAASVVEPFWMDQIWLDEVSELSSDADETDLESVLDGQGSFPMWWYRMEVESNPPSRPGTARGPGIGF